MNKLRIACIGTGYFSQFHYDAWRRIENVELVASVSLNIDEAKKTGLKAFDNLDAMFENVSPDLVDIVTPPSSHLDLIRRCVNNGVKNIICQKPFCSTLEEAREATALCSQNEVVLVIHENFRFQPWYRCMKKALDDGLLRDVHQLTFRLRTGDGQGSDAYMERQPYFRSMEKFLIRETGVHWIDTFRYLFGKPKSVYADLRKVNPAIVGEDAGYFIMEFEGEKRALFDANRHLDHNAENCRTTLGEALLEGSVGTITLAGSGEVTFRKFGSDKFKTLLAARDWNGFAGDCVYALQSHAISCICNGGAFENLAEDYLEVLQLEAAIYRSAESGKRLDV